MYAKCTPRERRDLWTDIRLSRINTSPWCIGGDFNIIAEASERVGGAHPNISAMNDFCDCIRDCELEDIGTIGIPFTWK